MEKYNNLCLTENLGQKYIKQSMRWLQQVGQQQYPQQPVYQQQQTFIIISRVAAKTIKIDFDQISRQYIKSEESILYQQFSTVPAPLLHPPFVHQFYKIIDEGN
ncbi:unnamed protein product [Paramecium sonneborni]|uniref:Uncharacterized protein n=1 Tax=Paramecium sonneborni TaxID=65129 RepID=A0A8S1M7C7_9CILI|nr:unnamed protein product [Paramecium sonneborni]